MYISEKYWENYIGGTDDSLTLIEHLSGKKKENIPLGEIFSDFGLDKLQGNFRTPETPLVYTSPEGWEIPIYYAIDLITDLAALLLECKVSGSIDLGELSGLDSEENAVSKIRITATPEEHTLMNQALMDFTASPLTYDLSEMVSDEDLLEMAAVCEQLRKELYESYN